jgi:hypothetical protein
MSEAPTNASILSVSLLIIKTEVTRQLFVKFPNIKFHANHFGGSTILARTEMDGRTAP